MTKHIVSMVNDAIPVVIIILYRETFIGNADKKCRHGGSGKRKRRWQSGKAEVAKYGMREFYFISTHFHNLYYACTYSKGMIHVPTKYSNRTSK
jgi:hypothetical protein